MKWGLDIEREVFGGIKIETGYSATSGIHLQRGNMQLNVTPRTIIDGRSFIRNATKQARKCGRIHGVRLKRIDMD